MGGLPLRDPTFETHVARMEVRMSNLLCALQESLTQLGVSIPREAAQDVENIRYEPASSKERGDFDAYVIFNNFIQDFIPYLDSLTNSMMTRN